MSEPVPNAPQPDGVPPPVCVLGIAPPGAPWYAECWPGAVVRTTRFRTRQGAVEQLAFRGGEDLGALPGLDPAAPSRVRDAVRLALAAGAPVVHVLLARGEALERPWMLDAPDLISIVAPFLDALHGTALVLPDADGPAPVAPTRGEDTATRAARLRRTLRAHAPGLAERYQVGLMDGPPDEDPALPPMDGADFALCRWEGAASRLQVHGWRCAAAAVAGALARTEPYQPLAGRRIPLGPGRRADPGRDEALGALPSPGASGPRTLHVHLDPTRDEAWVGEEPTLRRPQGTWLLPALRTVKSIHLALVRTAERFAFARLEQTAAFSLALALNLAVRPFVQQGLLVGPDGTSGPLIDGEVVRDPAAPSLAATISGQLRPWCHAVQIRVSVRDGAQPELTHAEVF